MAKCRSFFQISFPLNFAVVQSRLLEMLSNRQFLNCNHNNVFLSSLNTFRFQQISIDFLLYFLTVIQSVYCYTRLFFRSMARAHLKNEGNTWVNHDRARERFVKDWVKKNPEGDRKRAVLEFEVTNNHWHRGRDIVQVRIDQSRLFDGNFVFTKASRNSKVLQTWHCRCQDSETMAINAFCRTIPECALINNALGYRFKKILSNQLADTSKATAFLILRGLVSCQIQESDFTPKISGGTGTEIDRRRLATIRRDAGLVLNVENVLDEIRELSKNKSQEAYRQAKFLLDVDANSENELKVVYKRLTKKPMLATSANK
ncbi:hypothetical protein M3Y96_00164500 [Aphelenchoides besseyi]|nr:hypothetical protein M3Y96_00164500 [Aphelenchoides besseyi]